MQPVPRADRTTCRGAGGLDLTDSPARFSQVRSSMSQFHRKSMVLGLMLIGFMVPIGTWAEDATETTDISVESEKRSGSEVLFATNPFNYPVTITLRLQEKSENVRLTPRGPVTRVLRPKARTKIAAVSPQKRGKRWRYWYWYDWLPGSFKAKHDEDVIYRLPYEVGESYVVLQGPYGDFSHQEKVAIDWLMPEGTPIYAAREGRVVDVIDHFTEGGTREQLKHRANHVLIEHPDKTIGAYLHLQPEGARVELGEKVEVGQIIGMSGNTGYSDTPHLHFEIYAPKDGKTHSSESLTFLTEDGPTDELVEEQSYRRPKE